jgi:signal transduction histidine kinase
MLMQSATIEDLKKVIALSDLPDEHLQWLINHSDYKEYSDGDIIGKYGQEADVMWISWEGKVAFYMYLNGHQVYYFTFENNSLTGGVGGLLPYSRMKTYPGYSYAVGLVKSIRLHKKYFHELELLNPEFIQRLIGYMTTRARAFATTQLQHEKVNALGNLAAGIAHELNNPAAAISGISNELTNRISRNYELTQKLLQCNITPVHIQKIHELVDKKTKEQQQQLRLSVMQRMQHEDEIEEWLEANGITQRETAETLSAFGFSTLELESIRDDLGQNAFALVTPWLENIISSQKIINDLAEASGRISSLVASIKSHVHMDRTRDLQPTNIHNDIENTLTLLGFKLREKNIEVIKKFCNGLPLVPAFVGELNQVWTNLVDNAIYAVEKSGSITVETYCDDKNVTVNIIDNGTGIPSDIISRIFEPFFTTKKMGDGNGIGLDIVSRIIKGHDGSISVNSHPGRTAFSVCLPLMQKPENR